MPTVTLFEDDWYHNIIGQTVERFADDTSPDAVAIATGIMVAGACIAQALDHAFSEYRGEETIRTAVQEVANALSGIEESLRERDA